MKIIGVTGPSGAGKSFFCSFLAEEGCAVLDCDEIYHGLTDKASDCTRELSGEKNFGPGILKPDGSLDRRALAAVVFAPGAEEKLALLNTITHRRVSDEIQCRLAEFAAAEIKPRAVVIDAPLLFQAGIDKICDLSCALLAGHKLRLCRLTQRDWLDETALEARLSAAPDDAYYISRADKVIVNEGDENALRAAARELISEVAQ